MYTIKGMEISKFEALATAERLALAREIAGSLGPPFRARDELLGERGLAAIDLGPTTFAVIPGGTFDAGISPDERDRLEACIDDDEVADLDSVIHASMPVRRVTVAPFLMATRVMTLEIARALSPEIAALEVDRGRIGKLQQEVNVYPPEVAGILAGAGHGCRLPGSDEWEWVAREGGARAWLVDPIDWLNYRWDESPNAFGVHMRSDVEWVGEAGSGVLRGMHCGWQRTMEVVVTACGFREASPSHPSFFNCLRLARDLTAALR